MDLVRKLGERKAITKQKFKEAQENMKIEKMLEERQKSSNERELEGHFKREREANIKRKLDIIHKQENRDNWKGKSILDNGVGILHQDKSMLESDSSSLFSKNIFANQKNLFLGNKDNIPFMSGGFI